TSRAITLNSGGGVIETTGAGLVTLAGNIAGSIVASGTVNAAYGLTIAAAGPILISGTMTQPGGLTINSGTVTLSADNSISNSSTDLRCGINLNGGTLAVSSDTNLGHTGGGLNPVAFAGGTLLWNNGTVAQSFGRGVNLNSGGGTILTTTGAANVSMTLG